MDGDGNTVLGTGKGVKLAPESVTYEVGVTRDGAAVDSYRTYVDEYGVLHLGEDLEVGDVVTVTCTSTYVNPSGSTTAMADDVTATID